MSIWSCHRAAATQREHGISLTAQSAYYKQVSGWTQFANGSDKNVRVLWTAHSVRRSLPVRSKSKAQSKKRLNARLVKSVLTSGHLCKCVLLSSAEWAVKTGKRRGGFLTTVRPGLEKHAWWVHGRYFWVFQARRWNSSGDLRSSGHTLACPAKLSGCERRVNDILAQRVGRCFTLNGHTAGELTLTGAVCSGSETEHLLQDSLHGAPSTTGWSTGPWTVLCIVKTLFVNCA